MAVSLYPIKILIALWLIAVVEMSLQLRKWKMQDEWPTNTKHISKVVDHVEIYLECFLHLVNSI